MVMRSDLIRLLNLLPEQDIPASTTVAEILEHPGTINQVPVPAAPATTAVQPTPSLSGMSAAAQLIRNLQANKATPMSDDEMRKAAMPPSAIADSLAKFLLEFNSYACAKNNLPPGSNCDAFT